MYNKIIEDYFRKKIFIPNHIIKSLFDIELRIAARKHNIHILEIMENNFKKYLEGKEK